MTKLNTRWEPTVEEAQRLHDRHLEYIQALELKLERDRLVLVELKLCIAMALTKETK